MTHTRTNAGYWLLIALLVFLPLSVGTTQTDVFVDAVSREATFYNEQPSSTVLTDAISREVSFYNESPSSTVFTDAISREVSFYNEQPSSTVSTDAISREVSFYNEQPSSTVFTDAISREVSIINAPAGLPPDTQIASGPTNGFVCGDALTITCTGTDDSTLSSALEYTWRLDGGKWSEFSISPEITLIGLAAGPHVLEVAACDLSGDIDPTPAALNFTCDLAAPVLSSATCMPSAAQVIISWTTDELSTTEVDYGPTNAYGSTRSLPGMTTAHSITLTGLTPQTTYHYRVRSRDGCDRPSSCADDTFATHADTIPPETTITDGPDDGEEACYSPVNVIYTGSDDVTPPAELQYRWRVDDGAWSDWTTITTQNLDGLADGDHKFELVARDAQGNVDLTPAIRCFSLDTTPPDVSDIKACAVSGSQAIIEWTTDELANSKVEYGLTPDCGQTAAHDPSMYTTVHSVFLTGLVPNSTYHYRISTADLCGHTKVTGDDTFATTPDITRPDTQISEGPQANGSICTESTRICWSGSDDATPIAQLMYSWRLDAGDWTDYAVDTCLDLSGLTEGSRTVEVRSRDLAGNEDSSPAILHFSVDLTPPTISNVNAWASANQGTVVWATDEAATSQVEYGTTTEYGSTTTEDTVRVTTHRVVLSGLQPGITYYYRTVSKDGCGRVTKSTDGRTFATSSDLIPPDTRIVSDSSANGVICTDVASVCWTGTDDTTPADGLVYSCRLDAGEWSTYGSTKCHDFSGLAAGTHTLAVRSKDTAGNEDGTPAYLHFRVDLAKPIISEVGDSPTSCGAVVTWRTDEPATSVVEYGPTTSYGLTTADQALVTQHRVTITGLQPNSTYHFAVKSADSCGREGASGDKPFTTTSDVTAPNTEIATGPEENGISCATTVRVCWTGTDDSTSSDQLVYAWKMDSGSWSAHGPETCRDFIGLAEGSHTLAVAARDVAGNTDASPVYRHFRVSLSPPTISNVTAEPGADQAVIKWSTNESCMSQVEYGPTDAYGSITPPANGSNVTLADLQTEQTYHYRVRARNTCGLESISPDKTFATVRDTVPPGTSFDSGPTDKSKGCSTTVAFCWSGLDNVSTANQIQYSYKMDENDWSDWTSGACHSFADLSEGTHHVMVKAKDMIGNEDASPAERYFFVDLTSPTISDIAVEPRDYSASVIWNTNEPCTSQVEYGLTSAYGASTTTDPTMVGRHTVALRGLTPETIYHYRVISGDGCKGMASEDRTFTTTAVLNPNLRVLETNMRGTCRSLERIDLSWRTRNEGPGAAAGPWLDRVYLSADDTLDSQDLILSTVDCVSLEWASERWQSASIEMPMKPAGTYYLLIKTDAVGWITETDDTDNVLVTQVDYLKVKEFTVAPDQISLQINPGEAANGEIDVVNLGDAPVTGLSATVEGSPAGVSVQVSAPSILDGMSVQKAIYTATAADDSVPECTPVIKFATAEGAEASVTVNLTVHTQLANLVVNPGFLERSMLRGDQTLVEFEVTNTGRTTANDVHISIPEAPWMTLLTPEAIGDLPQGESAKVGIALKPAAGLALGAYTGSIGISASNASASSIGFRFTAISDQTGGIKVIAEDEFTYFAENKPPVADATVQIRTVDDGALIAEGRTNASGRYTKTSLSEGYYNIEVTADKHGTFKGSVLIKAGETLDLKSFLPRQLVTYSWKVEPVQTEDKYIVTLETQFETRVPAPVVTAEPTTLDLSRLSFDDAGQAVVTYTVSNHGLIAARGASIHFGSHSLFELSSLSSEIGEIPAMSAVTIPVLVRKLPQVQADVPEMSATGATSTAVEASTTVDCTIPIEVDYYWVCGTDNMWHKMPIYAFIGGCGKLTIPSLDTSIPVNDGGPGSPLPLKVKPGTVEVIVPPQPEIGLQPCCPIPSEFQKCTKRHQRPGYVPDTNGCGSGWFNVPDSFFNAKFTQACNEHDICYGTCGNDYNVCNGALRYKMDSICKEAYQNDPVMLIYCAEMSRLYYNALQAAGSVAWEAAQRKACCCDERAK